MTLKQLWSIIRGRRTNFRCLNMSWTYYPEGDPLGKSENAENVPTVTDKLFETETIRKARDGNG